MAGKQSSAPRTDKALYNFVYEYLEASNIPVDFFKDLENRYQIILFGGSVRDYITFKGTHDVRDFDFVISGAGSCDELRQITKKHIKASEWSYNQFGGVKIQTDDLALDCWRIEDTYAFRMGKVKTDIGHLLDTPHVKYR